MLLKLRLKRVGGLLAALMVTLSMSGCGTIAPVEVSVISGKFGLVFCTTQNLTSITLRQLSADEDYSDKFTVVATQNASVVVKANQQIVLGEGQPSVNISSEAEFAEGTTYQVNYVLSKGEAYSPIFTAPEGGLTEGTWLRSDGEINKEPCGNY